MSRIARVVIPDMPHHVTQRGNRQMDVFFSDSDRQDYLALLHEMAQRYSLRIWAYCLMTNHVHFVVVPQTELALARTFRDTHQTYSLRVNRRLRTTGHLWQGRFHSCVLDIPHALQAIRYVERNPLITGAVTDATAYRWSSAAVRAGVRADEFNLLSPLPDELREILPNAFEWGNWLNSELGGEIDSQAAKAIDQASQTGRPLGSPDFVAQLEQQTGRRLHAKPHGRPRKQPPQNPAT